MSVLRTSARIAARNEDIQADPAPPPRHGVGRGAQRPARRGARRAHPVIQADPAPPPLAVELVMLLDVLLDVVAVVGLHIKFFIMCSLAQTVMIYIIKIMI